jgi:hypothetical protein
MPTRSCPSCGMSVSAPCGAKRCPVPVSAYMIRKDRTLRTSLTDEDVAKIERRLLADLKEVFAVRSVPLKPPS